MTFRIEQKLLIDTDKLIDFKNHLADKNVKQIYQRRKIKSLYFENSNFEMYNDSIEGLTPRKKIRLRSYPGTKDLNQYLEIKISSVEGRFKTRSTLNKNKFDNLQKKGFLDSQYGLCKPCIYVIYDREYFKQDDVRISIDTNINYKSHQKNILKKDVGSIVEIKTAAKKDLDKLTSDFPFQKIRYSKYCNAIEKTQLR